MAAIGSGYKSTVGWLGETAIYGGIVRAEAGRFSAGIGGSVGSDGGTIRIYGGTVDAFGGDSSAGIGSGNMNGEFEIEVYGGVLPVLRGLGGVQEQSQRLREGRRLSPDPLRR